MTKQKQLIYDIIQNSSDHLNAEEIFEIAKKTLPNMVFATVYNNLNALVSEKKIMKIVTDKNIAYYDRNVVEHQHIICDCCGKIQDVFIPSLNHLLKKEVKQDITSYQLFLHYICDECKSLNKFQ